MKSISWIGFARACQIIKVLGHGVSEMKLGVEGRGEGGSKLGGERGAVVITKRHRN